MSRLRVQVARLQKPGALTRKCGTKLVALGPGDRSNEHPL